MKKLLKNIRFLSKKTPTYSLCWASELGGLPRTLFAKHPEFSSERMCPPENSVLKVGAPHFTILIFADRILNPVGLSQTG